jgi:hypothetical protein
MGDDEENEWTSSNIKGYDFEDDDKVNLSLEAFIQALNGSRNIQYLKKIFFKS